MLKDTHFFGYTIREEYRIILDLISTKSRFDKRLQQLGYILCDPAETVLQIYMASMASETDINDDLAHLSRSTATCRMETTA